MPLMRKQMSDYSRILYELRGERGERLKVMFTHHIIINRIFQILQWTTEQG